MRARAGFVLVPVVALLAVTLLLALASVDRRLIASRSARLAWQGERALHRADVALLEAITRWPSDSLGAPVAGETDTLPPRDDPTLAIHITRTRLSARRFLLQADVSMPPRANAAGGAGRERVTRQVARLVRLEWPRPPDAAALVVLGEVAIEAGVFISGFDDLPAGWAAECAADRRHAALPALLATATAVDTAARLVGAVPAVQPLRGVAREAAEQAFAQAFAGLASRATHRTADSVLELDDLAPAGAGAPCGRWLGDARRGRDVAERCRRTRPIVHVRHPRETILRGAWPAQGTLVVEGDLRLAPGVVLHGVVLVRGRLTLERAVSRSAPQLSGLIVVRDHAGRGSRLAGGTVTLGQCAARHALATAAVAVPERRRGWQQRP